MRESLQSAYTLLPIVLFLLLPVFVRLLMDECDHRPCAESIPGTLWLRKVLYYGCKFVIVAPLWPFAKLFPHTYRRLVCSL